jgi:ankyrin repeat protein
VVAWLQTEAVAYLVKNGADTSVLDVNQDSAMHWAAYKGELAIVQLLHHLGLAVRR